MSQDEPESTEIHTAMRCAVCSRTGACLQKKLLFSNDDIRPGSYVQETYPPGAVVRGHLALGRGIYTVCSGQLKVEYADLEDRVMFLRLAGEGETVLEPFMGSKGILSYSWVTTEKCSLCFLPATDLIRNGKGSTYVLTHLMEAHLQLLAEYQALLALRAVQDVRTRLVLALREASKKSHNVPGRRQHICFSHQDLARFSGLREEETARGLSELHRFGVETGSDRTISIFLEYLDAAVAGG